MMNNDDLELDDVTLFRDPVARKIASTAFWDEIYGDGSAIEDRDKLRVLKAACDELGMQFGAIGFFSFPPESSEPTPPAGETVIGR